MLTVAEALQLPHWNGATVVAGQSGIHNPVTWAHNAGVPDAPDWVNGGELVLTTGYNLPHTTSEQREYIQAMAHKGIAALAIAVGRYIDHIPDHMLDAANACNLPLVEFSYKVRFVDVVKAINERIAQQNMHMLREALHIHQTLTRVVLEQGDLQQLAHQLADLVGHSISIETERFDAIATVNIAAVDEARRYTQLYGRTDPRLVEALETRNILPEIRRTLRPLHLKAMPDVGLEMERILAPVVVHGEIYGFMWIIADDHEISQIDMMAIESGSTIAALMMLYQESVQSAEASLKGSLLAQLIQGDTTRETILTDQSLRYGVDLRSPYVLLLLAYQENGYQIYRRVNQLATNHGWQAVVGQFAGQLVLLVQATEDVQQVAESMLEHLRNGKNGQQAHLRIAISMAQQGVGSISGAHKQCLDALHIAQRLDQRQPIIRFRDLGYLHALYHAGAASLQGNPYVPLLHRLHAETQADLLNTLEAYLDAGGNGVQTAEHLHIHRSTLNYRLARIVQICEVDLADPLTRTNLQVALKLIRLFGEDAG